MKSFRCDSFLGNLRKKRFPASRMRRFLPSDLSLLIKVAFLATPPRGFLYQPHGSISPCTSLVYTIVSSCFEDLSSAEGIRATSRTKRETTIQRIDAYLIVFIP
jgi:hypothetical protein